jgi:hypothetical protein
VLAQAPPEPAKLGYAELVRLLDPCPPPGSRWRHYKDGRYTVKGAVIRESTQAPEVIYLPDDAYENAVPFARPLTEWHEEVSHEGKIQPRFVRLDG